jgi:hypothetical protein
VKLKENFKKNLLIAFCILAVCLVGYVLFQYPQPGVADQGDFDRVMGATGLKLTDENINNPNFNRFFNYIVTDYKTPKLGALRTLPGSLYTSIGYIITLATLVCNLFGQQVIKTGYLAVIYSVLYVFSMFVIIKYINIKNKIALGVLALLGLVVFFDGNYLLWFNSLYGEPMMMISLMLYISSWLYYFYYKNVLKSQEKVFMRIIFIFIAAFLFLGSKMQTITGLPIILLMHGKLLWENRRVLSRARLSVLCVLFCFLIINPLAVSAINKPMSKDTQYNSVFYGVLKDSKTPKQDLIDMGLNPDMSVEAGKHSYQPKEDYVKFVPRTEITEKEFYSKMSNGKLVKFYITHPMRLIQGMEYTAGKAFFTGTALGKYERSYSEEPIREFNRFTLWSDAREKFIPKRLIFIVIVYMAVLATSVVSYIRNKGIQEAKDKIHLLWAVILIGALQFPMPFMGNGQADTTKQLFLFNFIFDIILVVSVCWCFDKLTRKNK